MKAFSGANYSRNAGRVRREAAMQACFGPAPTVAEACGLTRGAA